MNNATSHSPTCPICGAPRVAQIEAIPVRGRINVVRQYSCGRRVQCTYALVGMRIHPDCSATNSREHADRQSKDTSSEDV